MHPCLNSKSSPALRQENQVMQQVSHIYLKLHVKQTLARGRALNQQGTQHTPEPSYDSM